MLPALIKNPVVTNRLQQITNTFLLAIMEEHILAKDILEPMLSRMIEHGIDPAIFGRVQVAAERKIIASVEKMLECGAVVIGIAGAYPATHRLNCK